MAEAAEALEKQPLSLGDIISRMVNVRDERRRISTRDKELIAEWKGLEQELLLQLDEQGMTKASTPFGTASITETVLPNVDDWDSFYEFIKEKDAFYLLQKRPAAAAFREHNDSGDVIPGVSPFTQRSIGLRKG